MVALGTDAEASRVRFPHETLNLLLKRPGLGSHTILENCSVALVLELGKFGIAHFLHDDPTHYEV